MADWLRFALGFSVIALAIVFAALAIISIVVALVRKLDDRWQAREKAEEEAAVERQQDIDMITLILISAAAATMVAGRFHIRSVRRLMPRDAYHGPWPVKGRAVLLGSNVVGTRSR